MPPAHVTPPIIFADPDPAILQLSNLEWQQLQQPLRLLAGRQRQRQRRLVPRLAELQLNEETYPSAQFIDILQCMLEGDWSTAAAHVQALGAVNDAEPEPQAPVLFGVCVLATLLTRSLHELPAES